MSVFKRMLSSIGIGSAKVDTVLDKDCYMPGEVITGVVHITAGDVEQQVDEIYFSITASYRVAAKLIKIPDNKELDPIDPSYDVAIHQPGRCIVDIAKYKLSDPFTLRPGDRREIPLSFPLPHTAPLTLGTTTVLISTELDIKKTIDPIDIDSIQVVPGRLIAALFETLEQLGFSYYDAECKEVPTNLRYQTPFLKEYKLYQEPFVQEFKFKPHPDLFAGQLDDLHVVCFINSPSELEILLEIDRQSQGAGRLLNELFDYDKTCLRLVLTEADLPTLADQLRDIIAHYSH